MSSDDPTNPVPLPPPPPPKGPPRPGEGHVRVLLIGINDYANIRNLGGCIDDLDRIEEYLKTRFEISEDAENISVDENMQTYMVEEEGITSLNIYRLENTQATYQNIISTFKEFLEPASYPDRVWIHFSGHGTESPTAAEFKDAENGKDQCLMCHDYFTDESGVVHNLIADKELAVLLDEVAGSDSFKPHVLFTSDSCHSGGLTRDPDVVYRNAEVPEHAQARDIKTYYGNYDDQEGEIVVPRPAHVMLTACNAKQLASEKDGGYFTNALIDTLEMTGGDINYADLLVRTRSTIKKRIDSQTPQFEVMGGASAYSRFLEGSYWGDQNKFEVSFFNGQWTMACGAIHGLNSDFENIETVGDASIEVYTFDQVEGEAPIAKASLKNVRPSYSAIEVTEGEETMVEHMDTKTFYGKMKCLPLTPEYVMVTAENQEAISKFAESWSAFGEMEMLNIGLLTNADTGKTPGMEVMIEANAYKIKDNRTGKIITARSYDLNEVNEVFISLIKIAKWHRLIALDNQDAASSLKDKINLSVRFEGENNFSFAAMGAEVAITATKENGIRGNHPKNRKYLLVPEITITGPAKPMYCYLISQFSSYKISTEDEKKSAEVLDGKTDKIVYLLDNSRNWGLNSNEDMDSMTFKLIVSESEIDHFQFVQENLTASRGDGDEMIIRSNSRVEDWCAITMKVDLIREEAAAAMSGDSA